MLCLLWRMYFNTQGEHRPSLIPTPPVFEDICYVSIFLCWLRSTSVLKRDSVHLEFRQCDPSFPVFLPGSRSLQDGHACPEHNGFSVYSPRAIRLLPRCDRPSPAML